MFATKNHVRITMLKTEFDKCVGTFQEVKLTASFRTNFFRSRIWAKVHRARRLVQPPALRFAWCSHPIADISVILRVHWGDSHVTAIPQAAKRAALGQWQEGRNAPPMVKEGCREVARVLNHLPQRSVWGRADLTGQIMPGQ